MSWALLTALVCVLGLAVFAGLSRRIELSRMARKVQERDRARERGAHQARLQHPVIDLTRCLGCATCVAACPEDGVLEIVHGQAMVVHGARCVGVSACERECPVGAITITLGDLSQRRDIPVLSEQLEAVGSRGLFLAGEVTAHALIKTAVDHGVAVVGEVGRRRDRGEWIPGEEDAFDLCVVGAGPAGLAAMLEARRLGLTALAIDSESAVGGTVAKYPRRKLVLTEPVELPLYGRFRQTEYSKEELIDLWQEIEREQGLDVRYGVTLTGLERRADGAYEVTTDAGRLLTRNVCLALGRRGVPRHLGVPGEDLPKVAYSLLDAASYSGRNVLVVGGGDSAVEAALALAEQRGNRVTLSYRKPEFARLRSRNLERLREASGEGRLEVLTQSELLAVSPDAVELTCVDGARVERRRIANDDVFVMIGGEPPFELLERAGVSFDPSLRPPAPQVGEQGSGFQRALAVAFGLCLLTLLWALWNADYYLLAAQARATHAKHAWLRPGMGLGLGMGIAAVLLILVNLAYLLRRNPRRGRFSIRWGSLQAWMTSHVATGILAFLCATLHAAMSPGDSTGGHAWWALFALLATGAVGRYFYAYVPRAANGRELELAEVKAHLGRVSEEWDAGQARFQARARAAVLELIERQQWRTSFLGRVKALFSGQRALRRTLHELAAAGAREGLAQDQLQETLGLTRRAYAAAVAAAHFEDVRGVLNTWRWLHLWMAVLMGILIAMHVVNALIYGSILGDGGVA